MVATRPPIDASTPSWFQAWAVRLPAAFVTKGDGLASTGAAPQAVLTDTSTANATSTIQIIDNAGSPYEQWVAGSGVVNRYYDAPSHVFRSPSGAEWGRITSNGLNVVAATVNGAPAFGWTGSSWIEARAGTAQQAVSAYNTGASGAAYQARVDSAVAPFMRCSYQASEVGSITTNGTATAFNTTSDERLKLFGGDYTAAAAVGVIRADPVRTFTWNEHTAEPGIAAVGWGAQTSYGVSPDLATPGTDEVDVSGRPLHLWGVDQSKRTPYLWAALGADGGVLDRLDALEASLTVLRSDFAAYKAAHP